MSTTTQLLAKLKSKQNEDDSSLYERVKMARDVLSDRGWVEDHYDSDADASEDLGSQYFASIHGMVTLGQMLEILAKFPTEKKWQQHRYNLKVMLDLVQKDKPKKERARVNKSRKELEQELVDMKLENAKLRQENAELKLRINRIELELQPA